MWRNIEVQYNFFAGSGAGGWVMLFTYSRAFTTFWAFDRLCSRNIDAIVAILVTSPRVVFWFRCILFMWNYQQQEQTWLGLCLHAGFKCQLTKAVWRIYASKLGHICLIIEHVTWPKFPSIIFIWWNEIFITFSLGNLQNLIEIISIRLAYDFIHSAWNFLTCMIKKLFSNLIEFRNSSDNPGLEDLSMILSLGKKNLRWISIRFEWNISKWFLDVLSIVHHSNPLPTQLPWRCAYFSHYKHVFLCTCQFPPL